MNTPRNANELATLLQLDYKTTRHHIEVLEENHLISSFGTGYGKVYYPSPFCEENVRLFEEIWEELIKRAKK
jgi:predicted transcriptional regulator